MEMPMEVKRPSFSQSSRKALRNPWFVGLVSLVVVVLGVNLFMIYLAFATSPGLVSQDYYERGRQYEKTVLQRQAARSALGWEVRLDTPERLALGVAGPIQVAAVDREGLPLTGSAVTLFAYRPSDAGADFSLPLEEEAPGRYRARVGFPLKGIWDLIVHIENDRGDFELARRINVSTE